MLNSRVYGKRDRDKSRLGYLDLRNWRKETNNTFFVLFVFFFEIFHKSDFWTPFIREFVANLFFRFVHILFIYLVKNLRIDCEQSSHHV